MKSPALTNRPVGRPALSQQTGLCEDDVIVDCNFDHARRVNHILTNGIYLMTSLFKILASAPALQLAQASREPNY